MISVSKADERYNRTGMDALKKFHYCHYHDMAFWHSCYQKELEEDVFTNQKICKVVVLGLS